MGEREQLGQPPQAASLQPCSIVAGKSAEKRLYDVTRDVRGEQGAAEGAAGNAQDEQERDERQATTAERRPRAEPRRAEVLIRRKRVQLLPAGPKLSSPQQEAPPPSEISGRLRQFLFPAEEAHSRHRR